MMIKELNEKLLEKDSPKTMIINVCKECGDISLDNSGGTEYIWCYNCGKMVEPKNIEVLKLSDLKKEIKTFRKSFIKTFDRGVSIIFEDDWQQFKKKLGVE